MELQYPREVKITATSVWGEKSEGEQKTIIDKEGKIFTIDGARGVKD